MQIIENEPLGTVQKAMAEAFMARSSPDGGMEQCYAEAYEHLKDMTVSDIFEWSDLLDYDYEILFFADTSTFKIVPGNE